MFNFTKCLYHYGNTIETGRKISHIKCVLQIYPTMYCNLYDSSSSMFTITFDEFTNEFDKSNEDEVSCVDKWLEYLRRFSTLTKSEPILKVYDPKAIVSLAIPHRVFDVHLSIFVSFMLVEMM